MELYLQASARDPADPKARSGLAEVHERLLARAENALLEERLDEAALAIETARKSGVESGRIAFLTAQLAKSREQVRAAQAAARSHDEVKPDTDKMTSLLNLSALRASDGTARRAGTRQRPVTTCSRRCCWIRQSGVAQEAEKALALASAGGGAWCHRPP